MIPDEFKPYIDEFTYKDTSVALDILKRNKCPLYLQALYVQNHPSVLKKTSKMTILRLSNEIDSLNNRIQESYPVILELKKNSPFIRTITVEKIYKQVLLK
jgi:hypothetical protein